MIQASSKKLIRLYYGQKKSVAQIASLFKCSEHKINYWLKKYKIQKRTISEGVYLKNNPQGDPFQLQLPRTLQKAFLYGLGVGLYWGEGNKKNLYSIRLGNSDPRLIKKFIEFLREIYKINPIKLRFGLQIFDDMSPKKLLNFWSKELGFSQKQFFKIVITPTRGLGTYREKSKHGVLTVHFSNKKLRDILCKRIESL